MHAATPWLIALAWVAALAGLVWLVGWSSVLTLRQVEVSGAGAATRAEVMARTADDLGRPLARLDPVALASDVEAIAEVDSAQVTRLWPNGLRVHVTLRQALAAVREGTGWRLVDGDGVVFGSPARPPVGLSVLDMSGGDGGAAEAAAGVAVLAALPDSLREQVTFIRVNTPSDVRLMLKSGANVIWGDAHASPRKADVLAALLTQRARTYDVSAPDRPTLSGLPSGG